MLAYLDVVASDTLSRGEVAADLPAALPAGILPITWRVGRLVLRYGTIVALRPHAEKILARLVAELRRVLTSPRPPGGIVRRRMPLRVIRTADEVGYRYRLAPESRAALQAVSPLGALPLSLGVTHESQRDFTAMFGEVHAELTRVLTGVDLEEVNALGGIALYDEHGTMLWDSRAAGAPGA